MKLPDWANDEESTHEAIKIIAYHMAEMSDTEREQYKTRQRERFGRFGEIITELAQIRILDFTLEKNVVAILAKPTRKGGELLAAK